MELGAKALDRAQRVVTEDVLDDPDVRVVPERQVDVRLAHDVDRDGAARRAAHGQPEAAAPQFRTGASRTNADGVTGLARSSR